MKAVSLNVACRDFPRCPVWLDDGSEDHGAELVGAGLRSSPIYPVMGQKRAAVSLKAGEHYIWFGFSIDAFAAITKMRREAPDLMPGVYTSHGLASLILICKKVEDVEALRGIAAGALVGEETWKVKDGRIIEDVSCCAPLPEFPKTELYLGDHGNEDGAIIRDVRNSLRGVCPYLALLSSEHEEMAISSATLSQQLSSSILFLQGRIVEDEFKRRLTLVFKNDVAVVEEAVAQVKFEKSDPQRATVGLHQYRDEAIQVAAVLQSVFQQGVAGLPPLLSAPYQAGTFSLLGLGGVFASLVALYAHVRKVFLTVQPERTIAGMYPKWKAPPLPSKPAEYEKWRASLKNFSEARKAAPAYPPSPSIFHLLYYSNRLGFRATKLSITAAYQSICLGMMPSWNVSTVFHEFLHAHVKAILAELFPLNEGVFTGAYELYRQRRSDPDRPKYLTPFIQALILHVVSGLYGESDEARSAEGNRFEVAECLDAETLKKGLVRYHDQIDELFVHVLDLNYFYDSDSETYIRSIWASWLTLPFITKRIGEYALRTLCAIASIDDGRQIDRFNRALTQLRTQLEALRAYDFSDKPLIEEVLRYLGADANVAGLRNRFFVLGPLADVVAEFFVFPKVQPQLFREVADALQNDSSYSYGFKPGEYIYDRIESPVKFLMDQLKFTLKEWKLGTSLCREEFETLWSLQAIASTLTVRKHSYERE
jgi:hypothetical protein